MPKGDHDNWIPIDTISPPIYRDSAASDDVFEFKTEVSGETGPTESETHEVLRIESQVRDGRLNWVVFEGNDEPLWAEETQFYTIELIEATI